MDFAKWGENIPTIQDAETKKPRKASFRPNDLKSGTQIISAVKIKVAVEKKKVANNILEIFLSFLEYFIAFLLCFKNSLKCCFMLCFLFLKSSLAKVKIITDKKLEPAKKSQIDLTPKIPTKKAPRSPDKNPENA